MRHVSKKKNDDGKRGPFTNKTGLKKAGKKKRTSAQDNRQACEGRGGSSLPTIKEGRRQKTGDMLRQKITRETGGNIKEVEDMRSSIKGWVHKKRGHKKGRAVQV